MFKSEIEGWEEVQKELDNFKTKIDKGIVGGLKVVNNELVVSLQKHIQEDVYDEYAPKAYPRRKNNPKFGRPIISEENMFPKIYKGTLVFSYLPDGSHSGKYKDTLSWETKGKFATPNADKAAEYPIKPNPVHGDDLIKRIETGKGYDWEYHGGARPFWQNFTKEQIEGGALERSFVKGMNETDKSLRVQITNEIKRENTDTEF